MKYNPDIHHRRSIRLKECDYSRPGACFVTICTQNRAPLFGMIQDEQMFLNGAGDMVQSVWDDIPLNYPGIGTDQFVIMPNHVHGIILILGDPHHKNPLSRSPQQNGQTKLSLPDMVHRIKTMTTKRYADGVKQSGWTPFPRRLWQRNYWEHIARNESELRLIREYIQNNPVKWESDTLSVEPAPSVHPFPLVP